MSNRWKGRVNNRGVKGRDYFGIREKGYKNEQKTRENKGTLWSCYPHFNKHIFIYPSFSWCVQSLRCACLLHGSQQKHKGVEKRQSEQRKQCSIAKGPQEQRCFHSKLLTEGKMYFSSRLFLSIQIALFIKFWIALFFLRFFYTTCWLSISPS